jgi:hypothetical protein
VPLQVPADPVNEVPARAVPEIVGREVFVAAAELEAVPLPASSASTVTTRAASSQPKANDGSPLLSTSSPGNAPGLADIP